MVSVVQDSTATIFISSLIITEKYYTNLHCQLEKKNVIKNNGLFFSLNQPFVFLHPWKYNLRLKQKFYDENTTFQKVALLSIVTK
jgi:hypothetical protein